MKPYYVTRLLVVAFARMGLWVGYMFAALGALAVCSMLTAGCSIVMLPDKIVDGVAVYVKDAKYVDDYCRPRVRVSDRGPRMYGCYIPADRTIMVAEGHPAVLAHELKHAQGWEHVGPCHSTVENPNGTKPDGSPCEWFRK